jgi:kynureninase
MDVAHYAGRAEAFDRDDPLKWLPNHFCHPPDQLYFDGNSLGLMSHEARDAVLAALDEWAAKAVLAWTDTRPAWFTWAEDVSNGLGALLGARPGEIALGASTTVMLHQLLATLYHPFGVRRKILLDESAFPTDRYVVQSFLRQRGLDPVRDLVIVPTSARRTLDEDALWRQADATVAAAVLPSVIFTTGEALTLGTLNQRLTDSGIAVIWDLSHSAGLMPHQLHDEIDAAVFCTYKYLNGGPGSPGGAFVNERLFPLDPGLAGWWGSRNDRQFHMPPVFEGAADTHALQLGTPSILSLAALAGSVGLLNQAGIDALFQRSQWLTAFLEEILSREMLPYGAQVVTPPVGRRGGHIALAHPKAAAVCQALRAYGVAPDFRRPDIIRLAPAPSTSRAIDCVRAAEILDRVFRDELWRPFEGERTLVT